MQRTVYIITIIIGLSLMGMGCSSSSTGGVGGTSTSIEGGDVSGLWTQLGSPYLIMGDISVPEGDTLKITSGTEVIFQGYYRLDVKGTLLAQGTFSDSIYFTTEDEETRWHGIRFDNSLGMFQYCLIERGMATGDNPDGKGGGIYADSSVVMIANTAIRNCSSDTSIYGYGGGIYTNESQLSIAFSDISNNTARIGGGLSAGGVCQIQHTTISNNTALEGGGIHGDAAAEIMFQYCKISGNTADWNGGGGQFSSPFGATNQEDDLPLIIRCEISNNSSGQYGGGLMFDWGLTPDITNCTFAGNSATSEGAAIYAMTAGLFMTSSIVADNQGTSGVYLMDIGSTITEVSYCDFWDNEGTDLDGEGIPGSFGIIEGTNANGDSCDTFTNIFLDPEFSPGVDSDYELSSTSPCIDAGNPAEGVEPDGTPVDIGAYYFVQ